VSTTNDRHFKEEAEMARELQQHPNLHIPIPDELEWRIRERIHNLKRKRRNRTAKIATAGVAAVCAASFCLAVNLSPAFAKSLSQVPVLSVLVDALRMDKGIEAAVENGHAQQIARSVTSNGIQFTLDHVVADDKRMLLTYSLKLDDSHPEIKHLDLNSFTIRNGEGELLTGKENEQYLSGKIGETEYRIRHSSLSPVQGESRVATGYMEIVSSDAHAVFPPAIQMSISSLSVPETGEILQGTWETSFTLDPRLANAKPLEYPGQSFEMNAGPHQLKLKVDEIRLYPTMTAMSISFLNPEDLPAGTGILYTMHLEDENGKVYEHIDDEELTDSGNVRPQFVSSYFDSSQELYLVVKAVEITSLNGGKRYEVNKRVRLY